MKFRDELETLRAEISSLRERLLQSKKESAADVDGKGDIRAMLADMPHQIKELLQEAEDTASAHPVATLAGVFTLGVAVGRLTAK
jgi:hypothetical protein